MFRNFKMVSKVIFGQGCFKQLGDILQAPRTINGSFVVFLVDDVFKLSSLGKKIPMADDDMMIWVNVDKEPTTEYVDTLTDKIRFLSQKLPAGIIGIGGGSTMDLAKAVSLMLTNDGLLGEATRGGTLSKPQAYTMPEFPHCPEPAPKFQGPQYFAGPDKKLGINSDHTVFDQIVLDPELILDAPVPATLLHRHGLLYPLHRIFIRHIFKCI
jgi:3-deoxy-alpha-D-manno-octulosonate 8-oxidase